MPDLDALNKVWTMAYHAKDLKGVPWTDEEKEALETVRTFIETNYPLQYDAGPRSNIQQWQVQKQSSGEVLFIGESWEEANEVAKLLTRTRHYNHNLLILVKIGE